MSKYLVIKNAGFWGIISVLTVGFSLVGIPFAIFTYILMTVFFLKNYFLDKSGISSAVFILMTYYFGYWPFRFQVGLGLITSTSGFSALFYFFILILFISELIKKKESKKNKLLSPIIFLIFLMFLSSIISLETFDLNRRVIFNVTVNYLIFAIIMMVVNRNEKARFNVVILQAVMCCGVVDVFYGVYQFLFGIPSFESSAFVDLGMDTFIDFFDYVKIISVSGSSYGLFYSIVFYLPMFILYGIHVKGKLITFAVICGAIGCVVLLLTFSERTAIVMLAIFMIVFVVLSLSDGNFNRFVFISLISLIVIVSVSFTVLKIFESFSSEEGLKFERMAELANPEEAVNMVWRFSLWENALNVLPSVMILGDRFESQFGYHMEYLNMIITFGIVGFVVWLVLLCRSGRILWYGTKKNNEDNILKIVSKISLSYFVALLFAAMPNNPFIYTSGLVFFVITGMISEHLNSEEPGVKFLW